MIETVIFLAIVLIFLFGSGIWLYYNIKKYHKMTSELFKGAFEDYERAAKIRDEITKNNLKIYEKNRN